MKILFNRYTDKQQRLIIPIGLFKEINEQNEAVAETPSYVKLLIVNEEKPQTIMYSEFLNFIETGALKQILL